MATKRIEEYKMMAEEISTIVFMYRLMLPVFLRPFSRKYLSTDNFNDWKKTAFLLLYVILGIPQINLVAVKVIN